MEGVSKREQVRAASIRISLCSLFRKWSAQCRTNWVREWPGKKKMGILTQVYTSITGLTREEMLKQSAPSLPATCILMHQCLYPIPLDPLLLYFILPSNSKLPSVRRARVMLPTSLASGMLVRLGEASWWARPFGMPGCRRGLCIRTSESIFSSPSWISFFSWGIWRLKSYSTAVRAGLRVRSRQIVIGTEIMKCIFHLFAIRRWLWAFTDHSNACQQSTEVLVWTWEREMTFYELGEQIASITATLGNTAKVITNLSDSLYLDAKATKFISGWQH